MISAWDRLVYTVSRLHLPSHWREVLTERGWWDAP
jgi:hypothetical protein